MVILYTFLPRCRCACVTKWSAPRFQSLLLFLLFHSPVNSGPEATECNRTTLSSLTGLTSSAVGSQGALQDPPIRQVQGGAGLYDQVQLQVHPLARKTIDGPGLSATRVEEARQDRTYGLDLVTHVCHPCWRLRVVSCQSCGVAGELAFYVLAYLDLCIVSD